MQDSKALNKGLTIRQNKLNKKAKKRSEIKPEQRGLISFVEFSERSIQRVNGRFQHPGKPQKGYGLQVENKIYLANGTYKMVNRSTLKITKRLSEIPDWANPALLERYQTATEKAKNQKPEHS